MGALRTMVNQLSVARDPGTSNKMRRGMRKEGRPSNAYLLMRLALLHGSSGRSIPQSPGYSTWLLSRRRTSLIPHKRGTQVDSALPRARNAQESRRGISKGDTVYGER